MQNKTLALAFAASQLGFCVVSGLLAGLWVDKRWGTMPLMGMIGLVLGFASGVFFLMKLVRSVRKDGA
jgi:F0F1-type ATP synthase assembly protein I